MPTATPAPRHSKSADPALTRARLLEAAERICAERGLHGATTREIAEAAGVNEVTLFRQFGSKEKLLGEMFLQRGAAQSEALSASEPDEDNLAHDLRRYAQRFNDMLFGSEALIRTLIAEARRQPDYARQVIYESARPLRQRVIAYLERAQKAGSVRRDLDLAPSVDAFTGMLLAGMLRRTSLDPFLEYSHVDYIDTAVDLFVRAIQTAPKTPRSGTARKRA